MKKKFKLGIIGCGYVGTSIVRGAVLSDFLSPKKIVVGDSDVKKLDEVEELGVFTCENNKFIAENSEYLVLAVKRQDFEGVVSSLGGYEPEKVISVISGLGKNKIKNSLGKEPVRVARCVPNHPCSIGSGVISVDMSDFNPVPDDTEFISKILDCMGVVMSVDESKLDAAEAVGCGGPAYAFMLIDALTDAGAKRGLTRGEAKALAVQAVFGAAEMARREEESLSGLLVKAANGGDMVDAVKVLGDEGLADTVDKAVEAVYSRNKELSSK